MSSTNWLTVAESLKNYSLDINSILVPTGKPVANLQNEAQIFLDLNPPAKNYFQENPNQAIQDNPISDFLGGLTLPLVLVLAIVLLRR